MVEPIVTIRGFALTRGPQGSLRWSHEGHRRTVELDRFGVQTLGGPIALDQAYWLLPVCDDLAAAMLRRGGEAPASETCARISVRTARSLGVRDHEIEEGQARPEVRSA